MLFPAHQYLGIIPLFPATQALKLLTTLSPLGAKSRTKSSLGNVLSLTESHVGLNDILDASFRSPVFFFFAF